MIPARGTTRSERFLLSTILVAFIATAVWYSFATPPFEIADELHHMGFVVHLCRARELPVQQEGRGTIFEQEGSQPPLYYFLAASLVCGLDLSDFEQVSQTNPYARIGLPSAIDNQNMVMHSPSGTPLRGSILALMVIRWFSVLLGLGTVCFTFILGRTLFPRKPWLALAGAATTAFTPMFVSLSGSVNNDNLITLLSSLTLVTLAQTSAKGVSTTRLVALGMLCGAALLAKLSGIALLAIVLLALLVFACSEEADLTFAVSPRDLRRLGQRTILKKAVRRWIGRAAVVIGVSVLLAGWWYLRNLRLYGELTGIQTMLSVFGRREGMPTLGQLIGEFRGFRMSYWGVFGGFNVLLQPGWVYPILHTASILALGGGAYALYRGWQRQTRLPWPLMGLLVVWVGALAASLLRWTSMTYASQGRLIFPGIPVLSLFLVGGLGTWFRGRLRHAAYASFPALLLAISLAQPLTALRLAYAAPTPLTLEQVPATAQPLHARFDDVELLAYEIDRPRVEPGGRATVTLYWRAHQPLEDDLTLYIHVFGRDGAKIAQRDSFHGGGTYPTSYWEPGLVIRDRYAIDFVSDALGPTAAEIVIGLYRREGMLPITATDPSGNPVGRVTAARIKVTGETPFAEPQWPVEARFGDAIVLRGYDLDGAEWDGETPLPITLHWQVLGTLGRDLTVFVHLVDDEGRMLGQGDAPPLGGEYPTSFWEAGEYLTDSYLITMQERIGAVRALHLLVGFYDPLTGERLPVTDTVGATIGDHALITLGPDSWR